MNLILVSEKDFISESAVRLAGRRFSHIRGVLKAVPDETIKVGLLGGKIGKGRVLGINDSSVDLAVEFTSAPPPAASVKLVLALPRPKFLKRILLAATTFGIKDIYLVNAVRVEKSYWHCEQIKDDEIRKACLLGLEQSVDTLLPRVHLRRLFKPFVEDELPALAAGHRAFVGEGRSPRSCPCDPAGPVFIAVGPEGGFIPYEVEKLMETGFMPVSLGPRVLRVETAMASLVSRLLPLTPPGLAAD